MGSSRSGPPRPPCWTGRRRWLHLPSPKQPSKENTNQTQGTPKHKNGRLTCEPRNNGMYEVCSLR